MYVVLLGLIYRFVSISANTPQSRHLSAICIEKTTGNPAISKTALQRHIPYFIIGNRISPPLRVNKLRLYLRGFDFKFARLERYRLIRTINRIPRPLSRPP